MPRTKGSPPKPATPWGLLIKEARETKGYTQEQLASRMKTSPGTISNLEIGRVESVLKHIDGLSLHLGLSPAKLLERMGVKLDVSPLARLPLDLQAVLPELRPDEVEVVTRVARGLVADRNGRTAKR